MNIWRHKLELDVRKWIENDVKTEAHAFSRTVSGAKQTKMKSPSQPVKIAVCEQNLKIAANLIPKTQSQPEKIATCERALRVHSHVAIFF